MSQFVGMDIDGVRMAAAQMNTAAAELQQVVSRVSSILSTTAWFGQDADHARQEWQQTVPILEAARELLEGISERASANATEQSEASR